VSTGGREKQSQWEKRAKEEGGGKPRTPELHIFGAESNGKIWSFNRPRRLGRTDKKVWGGRKKETPIIKAAVGTHGRGDNIKQGKVGRIRMLTEKQAVGV